MAELPFDDDGLRVQWIEPDERGGVLRTRYRGTQDVLDQNAALRNDTPKSFIQNGEEFHHVASIPMEVYEQLMITLGRHPTAEECLMLAQDRDYSQLRTREVKL